MYTYVYAHMSVYFFAKFLSLAKTGLPPWEWQQTTESKIVSEMDIHTRIHIYIYTWENIFPRGCWALQKQGFIFFLFIRDRAQFWGKRGTQIGSAMRLSAYLHAYTLLFVRMHVCMQTCTSACMCACIHECLCVCMIISTYVHMNASIDVCTNTCIHTHTHTHRHRRRHRPLPLILPLSIPCWDQHIYVCLYLNMLKKPAHTRAHTRTHLCLWGLSYQSRRWDQYTYVW